jgi:1,4-alpha-glucan branching enzyme
MYAHPGKKLNFMGNEIGQSAEWNHDSSINWHLLEFGKHSGIQALYRDLNKLYTQYPALHEMDHDYRGFEWIDHANAEQSTVAMLRQSKDAKQQLYALSNFTPVPRTNFRLGVKALGEYSILLNTDDKQYWGSGHSQNKNITADETPWNNQPYSIGVSLPPLATVFILYKGQ